MSNLSNSYEDKIKVAIESYLIENILKLDNVIIQLLNQENLTVTYQLEIFKVLYELFMNKEFANFSISNNYIEKSDIVEILRYCKINYKTIEHDDYSQLPWDQWIRLIDWRRRDCRRRLNDWRWHEDTDCDDDFDISYIICLFSYSYMLDNKNYFIELINKLCNIDTYVVLK